ncbi:MAG: hypothetical protein VYA54_09685 [Bdellovibrionota bacterium]|nr:hypothetical protein [Bdellovibrionota bacterium]
MSKKLALALSLIVSQAFAILPEYDNEIADFTSDGCSMIYDSPAYIDCCKIHDYAYWQGGPEVLKEKADSDFSACVEKGTRSSTLAGLFQRGVEIGGHPQWNRSFRWGYGWKYNKGFAPLSKREQGLVIDKALTVDQVLATPKTDDKNKALPYPSKNNDYCLDEAVLLLKKHLGESDSPTKAYVYKAIEVQNKAISDRYYELTHSKCENPVKFSVGEKRENYCTRLRAGVMQDSTFIKEITGLKDCQ